MIFKDLQVYDTLDKQILAECLKKFDTTLEVGGIYEVLSEDKQNIIFIPNEAEEPEKYLTFSNSSWEMIFEKITKKSPIGLFHTHCNDKQDWRLSYQDIVLSRNLGIPIICYHSTFKLWDFYSPNIPHPYPLRIDNKNQTPLDDDWFLDWEYQPGRADCYSIIEYFYKGRFEIQLPELLRTEKDFNERNIFWDRFQAESKANGFTLCRDRPQIGDVVLFNVDNKKPNHCGLIIDEVSKNILHLLGGKRKSEIKSITLFKNMISGVYRHNSRF
ncbi:MAG: NlpC/P60 family protein [Cyanobacteria bacterium P01_A01_bin.80]